LIHGRQREPRDVTHPAGEDRVVWASDYPHLDATYPGVVRELEEQLVALPSSARDKVRGENAARLYRLS